MSNNKDLILSDLSAGLKVLLIGSPGCGKSQRLFAAAQQLGFKQEIIRLSVAERIDMGGIPIPVPEQGVVKTLPPEQLHRLQHTTEPTLLVIDDIGQAPIDVQSPVALAFDPGYFSPCVRIAGTSNFQTDRAGVFGLNSMLQSRFDSTYIIPTPNCTSKGVMLGDWQDEVNGWIRWAESIHAHECVIAFHKFTAGKYLYTWEPSSDIGVRCADYRAWHTIIKKFETGLTELENFAATLGNAVSVPFYEFAKIRFELPTYEEAISNPTQCRVPERLEGQWIMQLGLLRQMKKDLRSVRSVITYTLRFNPIIVDYIMDNLFVQYGVTLLQVPEFEVWFKSNRKFQVAV